MHSKGADTTNINYTIKNLKKERGEGGITIKSLDSCNYNGKFKMSSSLPIFETRFGAMCYDALFRSLGGDIEVEPECVFYACDFGFVITKI